MSQGITYGINFPFQDSSYGNYFELSQTNNQEIRNNLVHLLLTRKGSRYFLPDFGTRLYEFIFEPMDGPTFSEVESEIRDSVEKYLPNLTITKISVTDASTEELNKGYYINENEERIFKVPNMNDLEHTIKIKIDYLINTDVFNQSDFVIINI